MEEEKKTDKAETKEEDALESVKEKNSDNAMSSMPSAAEDGKENENQDKATKKSKSSVPKVTTIDESEKETQERVSKASSHGSTKAKDTAKESEKQDRTSKKSKSFASPKEETIEKSSPEITVERKESDPASKAPSSTTVLSMSSKETKMTKDTAQRTIPDYPIPPSTKASSGGYLDFAALQAPDDVTEARSDYTPIGIAKAKSEERLAIGQSRSPQSYGSRSDLQSNFVPPTIIMDEPAPRGTKPVRTTCKYCYKMIQTEVKFVANQKTYTACLLLFVLLLWPFIWIPFVVKSCKEAVHRCPNCGTVLSHSDKNQYG